MTSSILEPETYPQFASEEAADWASGAAAFDPHTEAWYMTSQNINQAYKRLTRTVDLRGATSGNLSFWTSYNTEPNWDFVFVEAQSLNADGTGAGDWTTLPDANGHTGPETGASCAAGWSEELHNRLRNYTTYDPAGNGGMRAPARRPEARYVERRERQLRGLAAVEHRPVRLRGRAGRALDRVRHRLGHAHGARHAGGRHDRHRRRHCHRRDLLRDGSRKWSVPGAHPEGPSVNLNDWIRSEVIFEDAVTKTDEVSSSASGSSMNTPEARAT